MKLINNFATKSSLTGRWVGISAENWRISGEIVTKNIKCCRQTGNRGGHFVFWDIEPEMLGHNPAEVPGHRPVILLTNQHRVPPSIFFSSLCCSIQVSMQTTGFHTRLLKRIDILVATMQRKRK